MSNIKQDDYVTTTIPWHLNDDGEVNFVSFEDAITDWLVSIKDDKSGVIIFDKTGISIEYQYTQEVKAEPSIEAILEAVKNLIYLQEINGGIHSKVSFNRTGITIVRNLFERNHIEYGRIVMQNKNDRETK